MTRHDGREPWQRWTLDHNDTILLAQWHCSADSYTIHLTDLTRLWTQSLSRRSIIQQALATDTSIDPSEDAGQLRMLLASIGEALDEYDGTAKSVFAQNEHTLVVNLTTPLRELRPLTWTMTLTLQDPDRLCQLLTLPLLFDRLAGITQCSSLIQILHQKDDLIRRLLAQMQSDACDLGKLFPGLLATGTPTRGAVTQKLQRSVPGMREFDEQTWRRDLLLQPPTNLDRIVISEPRDSPPHRWWEASAKRERTVPAEEDRNSAQVAPDDFDTSSTDGEAWHNLGADTDSTFARGDSPRVSEEPQGSRERGRPRLGTIGCLEELDKPRLGTIGGSSEVDKPGLDISRLDKPRSGTIGPRLDISRLEEPRSGTIGGSSEADEPRLDISRLEEPRSDTIGQTQQDAPPRETSQERIDRRKQELAKELEQKSRVPIKKRKF